MFCPVQSTFATSINTCRRLTNAHYEVLRPSEHRLDFILQKDTIQLSLYDELQENMKSAQFTENKLFTFMIKSFKQMCFFEVSAKRSPSL